jgi:hypothetical protein
MKLCGVVITFAVLLLNQIVPCCRPMNASTNKQKMPPKSFDDVSVGLPNANNNRKRKSTQSSIEETVVCSSAKREKLHQNEPAAAKINFEWFLLITQLVTNETSK